jgi:hypothetical protein
MTGLITARIVLSSEPHRCDARHVEPMLAHQPTDPCQKI